jgi:hypothetical protein
MAAPSLIHEPIVKAAMRDAIERSKFGPSGGHEEGAFILRASDGQLRIEWWTSGRRRRVGASYYADGKIGDCEIVGSFHTHPNTDPDYVQEPSDTDRDIVAENPKAWGEHFVISQEFIYHIGSDGKVTIVGRTEEVLGA